MNELGFISYLTASMNRLHHLKETLPYSLKNLGPCAEIVLLDYNSQDGLRDYILAQHQEALEDGSLSYLRTNEPTFFHHSHARKVLALAAEGPILCVLDADNFLMPGFSQYLLERFSDLGPDTLGACQTDRSNHGRIALLKKHWLALGGYDEEMLGWGWEDNDFRKRALKLGLQKFEFNDELVSKVIEHGDEDRVRCLPPHLKDRWRTNEENRRRHLEHRAHLEVKANQGRCWGVAQLRSHRDEKIVTGSC